MKKSDVKIGSVYTAKVSDKVTEVRIDGENRSGGWNATNLTTNKKVHIKSAQRLRAEVKSKKSKVPKSEAKRAAAAVVANDAPAAEAASEAAPVKAYDPNRCATPRCKREPALTHLGKPLCQKCWERQCREDEAVVATAAALTTGDPADDVTVPTPGKKTRAKKDAGEPKPKRVSAIDAAAEVLETERRPMGTKELVIVMTERGLWASPNGKTPHATLYSAILREITTKGDAARFRKVERGRFEFSGTAGAEA